MKTDISHKGSGNKELQESQREDDFMFYECVHQNNGGLVTSCGWVNRRLNFYLGGSCLFVNRMEYLLVTGKNTNSTALLHATEIFLGFAHVGIDLIHSLLDAIELFCNAINLMYKCAVDSSDAAGYSKNRISKSTISDAMYIIFLFLGFL